MKSLQGPGETCEGNISEVPGDRIGAHQRRHDIPSREVTVEAMPKPFAPGRLGLLHTASQD